MKISKVKRNNQKRTKLTKQGKLKARRHKPKKQQVQKPQVHLPDPDEVIESDDPEDLADMIEKDDLQFLKNAASNKSYSMLRSIAPHEKKRKVENVEEKYEKSILQSSEYKDKKSVKLLLPIKTADGAIKKRVIEKEQSDDEGVGLEVNEAVEENIEGEQRNEEIYELNSTEMELKTPLSTAKLLAYREEILSSRRYSIGLLSSGILENPELRTKNFDMLLNYMEERNPEVYVTVRKLATASLLEIFKDLLPSYELLQLQQEGVKLKKDTLQLRNYELSLIRYYKKFLQKLEKIAGVMRRKGSAPKPAEEHIQLGILAVKCMCDLLVTHPYFNYSTNISNFLCLFLDNKHQTIREIVFEGFTQVFKSDKRGELTLAIVRRLNGYIKLRGHSVRPEVIGVLLGLRIKDINLDKEKEDEMKKKKLMSHKERILALSKRERKKNKKLEQVEKELLETKAEENKQATNKIYTEITSVVFTIYFRIIKQAPNSKVLSTCLEGLAKFAHCINIEFYEDLVNVLNKLLNGGELGLREQLHCIQTVFTILSGQATSLSIDPIRFYTHIFKNLSNMHVAKTNSDIDVIIKILVQALVMRYKTITPNRLVSFIKRIATMSLNLQHNGALATLCIIKTVLQRSKTPLILLDTDSGVGDGVYQPELDDPEYTNAHCTSLWELVALQRHYHSVVQSFAKNIAWETPATGEGAINPEIAKLSPEEIYFEYDPSNVAFKPAVPVPKKVTAKKTIRHHFADANFEEYLNSVYTAVH